MAAALAALASLLALLMPQVLKWIVDGPVAQRKPSEVVLGGLALLLMGAAEALIFGVRRWVMAGPLADIEAGMRADFYRHVQRLPIAVHDGWSSGQLLSRGTSDPQVIHMAIAGPLTFLPVHASTLVIGAVILISQQWLLAVILLSPVPLLIFLSYRFESRYAGATRRARDLSGDLTTTVLESVTGIRVIKGFRRSDHRIARFRDQVRRAREAELHKARLLGGMAVLITGLPGLAMVGALLTGAVQAAHGQLSTGTLLAFMGTVAALRPAIEQTGALLAVCHDGAAAVNRYFEVLDQPRGGYPRLEAGMPDTAVSEGGSGTNRNTGRAALACHDAPCSQRPAELVFAGVGFRYPSAPADDPPALQDISLRVAPGETLAVVGATGSGKTTLASLVARLYDPTAGHITLDGVDISAISRAEMRSTVAVAFDEPVLFSGTISDNVLMGAEADPDELARALRATCADKFVDRLAEGGRTRVGENGMSLSGGQRQRIALARVMVRRPRVAVLDDPLSALDMHTEAQIQDALREVLASTTAVVIAHRPSTVLMADRVAVLAAGRVIAVGTHEELLHASSAYRALMTPIEMTVDPREGL
ncbi:ABC transporter ATP-binding protein [Streptomyces sp. ME19-01-6]|uniref:ABC transporter ATP-binding protein n=1 Tax=Streptomyces sp. ME19-01-6 TaxID=3028686 RepID=UPI0029B878F0|nr:ABC transporter ATP-binding protein [Streptomyces sp. ME19-01-6]MDX3228536.1 ABC transporter ATP-binding protein [Streptomyces sp. ME19-01-6]